LSVTEFISTEPLASTSASTSRTGAVHLRHAAHACRDPAPARRPCGGTRGWPSPGGAPEIGARSRCPGCGRRHGCGVEGGVGAAQRVGRQRRRRGPRAHQDRRRAPQAPASAVIACVPLISATASFAPSISGAIPTRSSARRRHLDASHRTLPRPISGSARCASGADRRSLPPSPGAAPPAGRRAPTTQEGFDDFAGRTPECPLARVLRRTSSMPRTGLVVERAADNRGVAQRSGAPAGSRCLSAGTRTLASSPEGRCFNAVGPLRPRAPASAITRRARPRHRPPACSPKDPRWRPACVDGRPKRSRVRVGRSDVLGAGSIMQRRFIRSPWNRTIHGH
jgi:hypothetical protein